MHVLLHSGSIKTVKQVDAFENHWEVYEKKLKTYLHGMQNFKEWAPQ